jgi:hypothetical protein
LKGIIFEKNIEKAIKYFEKSKTNGKKKKIIINRIL